MKQPRTLIFDIETAPQLGYTWTSYEANVIKVVRHWHFLSFAYKWLGEDKVYVYALPDFPLYKKDPYNDRELVKILHKVLEEADVVVGQNSDKFDIKKSNTRFLFHGLTPTHNYRTVDTLKLSKKYFSHTSNSLNNVSQFLGIGEKVKHEGFDLWDACMEGDMKAWAKMKKYNKGDIVITEKLYLTYLPWNTQSTRITEDRGKCGACGGADLIKANRELQKDGRYKQQYQCRCGKYTTGGYILLDEDTAKGK